MNANVSPGKGKPSNGAIMGQIESLSLTLKWALS